MQKTLREDWRAGYAETCKSGSEGSTAKPNTAMYHGRVALTLLVLPGTVETFLGREPFFNNKKDGHVDLFNQIADKQFEMALDHTIGDQWRTLRPGLEQATTQPDLESELDKWFGPRDAAPDFDYQSELDKWFGPHR